MIAALATLASLSLMWLLARFALDMAEQDGVKIVAALRGRSLIATPPVARPVSARFQPRATVARRPLRAQPLWRAAA